MTYAASRLSASAAYNNCTSQKHQAADYAFKNIDQTLPYAANTAVINAESNYHCEDNYKTTYQTVKNTLINNYSEFTLCTNVNTGVSSYIGQMRIRNIINPVEQITSLNKNGSDYFINAFTSVLILVKDFQLIII